MITKELLQLKLDLMRSNFSYVPASRKTYYFLKSLLQLGLIVFFKNTTIDNKKKYKVKFSKWGGKTIVKKLIVIKKSKSNTVGTYTILQKLNKENIFIVSNNSGIENLNFNLWKNNGGILLCKIII